MPEEKHDTSFSSGMEPGKEKKERLKFSKKKFSRGKKELTRFKLPNFGSVFK